MTTLRDGVAVPFREIASPVLLRFETETGCVHGRERCNQVPGGTCGSYHPVVVFLIYGKQVSGNENFSGHRYSPGSAIDGLGAARDLLMPSDGCEHYYARDENTHPLIRAVEGGNAWMRQ